jgi:Ca-activated chloride channel family protein
MNDDVHSLRTAPGAIARAPSPLTATAIDVEIQDLLATIKLEQRYANQESEAIEVSYTIALPTDAALLDVEVEIGGQRLRGRVQPKQEAEMRYEQALAEGHSAFSIRMVDEQLLNIALGNLKPGEQLKLTIVMAQWLQWNGNRVRLTLPTTIAPRYGQCSLQPVDRPQVDLLAEHGFRLEGRVRGLLGQATLSSATHSLSVRAAATGLDLAIARGHLDRDIVIDLTDAHAETRISGARGRDLAGFEVAMVTFCAHADAASARPVIAELVIDCSGSMAGVSIEQTRVAVRAIVSQLTASDRVNVLRFGSGHQLLLRRPQPATLPVQRTILQGADELEANLGGTELLSALTAGLDDLARVPATVGGERVLFVISDGEVWGLDDAALLQRCAREHVRVFAVAVGSAAVEATFAPLTRGTGGALERVLPGDAMAERIQRHFARVRSGALRNLEVSWPAPSAWTRGASEVYPGDGTIFSAGLVAATSPAAVPNAQVGWLQPDGQTRRIDVPLPMREEASAGAVSVLARMLARERIAHTEDREVATRLAVDYQLVTAYSAITLVLERAAGEQLDRLPPLRVVPQMLSTGWGGSVGSQAPAAPMQIPCPAPSMDMDMDMDFYSAGNTGELAMPEFEGALCEDTSPFSDDLSAPPADLAPTGVAAPPPPAHPLHVAARKVAGLFSRNPPTGARVREQANAFVPVDPVREQLIALLVVAFKAQPGLLAHFQQGTLSLSALALELSPPQFNWLDERAEAAGLDLESNAFWHALIVELSADIHAQALRSLLGTL